MPKAIRFSELVQKAGRPYAATLWTDPSRDAAFHKAVKENRVVTVKQETVGHKKDFGTIGFSRAKNVTYFVFPKKLPNDLHARVVGIKYDLLDTGQPGSKGGASVPASQSAPSKRTRRRPTATSRHRTVAKPGIVAKQTPAPRAPRGKEFVATVRRVAAWETTLRVKARNKTEARRRINAALAAQKFPESEALLRHEIRSLDETPRS